MRMTRLSLTTIRPGRRSRSALAFAALALLCVALVLTFAGTALAADETTANNTTSNPNVTTSAGLEAPSLDYTFVWWTFILTFGLLIVYYVVILRISDKEFIKIIDAHFGPKRDGR
jgi:hypothetical protein